MQEEKSIHDAFFDPDRIVSNEFLELLRRIPRGLLENAVRGLAIIDMEKAHIRSGSVDLGTAMLIIVHHQGVGEVSAIGHRDLQ